jgi:hypothetical protein
MRNANNVLCPQTRGVAKNRDIKEYVGPASPIDPDHVSRARKVDSVLPGHSILPFC